MMMENHSRSEKRIQKLERIRSIFEKYYEFGTSTPTQTKESQIPELLELVDGVFPKIVRNLRPSEMDTLEITVQRLQHRFGNQDAGCIDVDNAQSLDRMLPEAIDVLEMLIDELKE